MEIKVIRRLGVDGKVTIIQKNKVLFFKFNFYFILVFPGGSPSEESARNAGDPSSVPGWGRSSGGGNGDPLRYSCLGIPRTEGPGRYSPWSRRHTAEQLGTHSSFTEFVSFRCGAKRFSYTSVLFQILFPCYYRILSRAPCDKFLFKNHSS